MQKNSQSIYASLRGVWQAEIEQEGERLRFEFPVPGDLVSALVRAGLIPHPYWAQNELDIQWVGKRAWRMWREFDVDDAGASGWASLVGSADASFEHADVRAQNFEQLWIEIDVLDTVADVYVNGQRIGAGRNMFTAHRFCIDPKLVPLRQKGNRLEIRFTSAEDYARSEAERLPYPVPCSPFADWGAKHRNLLRKAQCHSGWDWGPCIMTSGVYGDVRLYSAPCLERLSSSVHLLSARVEGRAEELWELRTRCEYLSNADDWVDLLFSLRPVYPPTYYSGQTPPAKPVYEKAQSFEVRRGRNVLNYTMQVENPRLWWPHGYGQQNLYELEVSLHQHLHQNTLTHTIGFRRVELIAETDKHGRSMTFRINGRDIYAKGANWIPPDALPAAQSPETYRTLLHSAVQANMNMLRVWGGGQYEGREFYELCDRLGILVWQDFMFACALYPTSEDFLANVEAEVDYQVRRLLHHPCIVLWCGNNEDLGALTWYEESQANRDRYVVDYDRLNEGSIARRLRSIDSTRPWWPSSPSAGEGDYSDCWHDDTQGDMHYWSVWHEGLPFEAYYTVVPRFCSEFGFQSFPSLYSVRSFAPEEEWNVSSPAMLHHQRHPRGNSLIISTIANYFRMPTDFEQTLYLSQVQQAFAIRTAVDYWRSKRPQNMGALYWQINDLWPVASWSSIEYGGRWKLLHYAAQQFYAPLSLSLFIADGQVQAHIVFDGGVDVNANVQANADVQADGTMFADSQSYVDVQADPSPSASKNFADVQCALSIRLISFSGEVLMRWESQTDVHANSATLAWSMPIAELISNYGAQYSTNYTGQPRPHPLTSNAFIHAECSPLHNPNLRTAENSLFLSKPQNCNLKQGTANIVQGASPLSFTLSSEVPLFYVFPECEAPGHFSAGCFTLLPNEERSVEFIPQEQGVDTPSPADIGIKHLRSSY